MSQSFVSREDMASFWEKLEWDGTQPPVTFELEITARCNNNCRHCYINLPANDRTAKENELSLGEIKSIADEAVSLGAMWCLITGGEPLLREDFFDVYLFLKQKGLLVQVFTNASLVTKEHIQLFLKYPPRDIEVSVYGVTEATYEAVTRRPGSFAAFMRGLDLLTVSGVRIRLKAMALRSNLHELSEIARFCRERTKDYFRFDPWLHLRFDGNERRNEEIRSERLSAEEFVAAEQDDAERFEALNNSCKEVILHYPGEHQGHGFCNHLFHCGAGRGSFSISYDGIFRLCSSLWHPHCVYDLRRGSLADAYYNFIPKVRHRRTDRQEFLQRCRICPIINICLWCPAHSYLETGEMDTPVDYFCQVAHARAKAAGVDVDLTGARAPSG